MSNFERTCIVCKMKNHKNTMFRIVFKNKILNLEEDKKLDGRGCYVCKNNKCADMLVKTKAFNRAFKTNIPLEDYEKIINKIKIS